MTNDTARFDKSALKLRRIVHALCHLSGHLSSVRKKFARIRSDRDSYAKGIFFRKRTGFRSLREQLAATRLAGSHGLPDYTAFFSPDWVRRCEADRLLQTTLTCAAGYRTGHVMAAGHLR